jgi:CubicO group peptidase (beta-lactamase class C family)
MWNKAIDQSIQDYMARSQVPGLAIGVAEQGEFIHCAGYGVQDRRTGQPVTPETLFHLASVVYSATASGPNRGRCAKRSTS